MWLYAGSFLTHCLWDYLFDFRCFYCSFEKDVKQALRRSVLSPLVIREALRLVYWVE
jgi:molybdenum cofactor biosynthesis enzyme MoaA